jgi:hypothetical protein
VEGYTDLLRAFKVADRTLTRELRGRLRDVARPVADTAERLTAEGRPIRNLSPGDPWSGMRVGVTTKVVYVAPKERGRRTRDRPTIARPNLADRLMEDAMSPALDQHTDDIVNEMDRLLAEVGRDWEQA